MFLLIHLKKGANQIQAQSQQKCTSTELEILQGFSEDHYVTKKFFVRFRLLEAIFLFVFIPWSLLMIKIISVKFFRSLKLSEAMTSYLTTSEFFFLKNMTFNADQLLIKYLGLKTYWPKLWLQIVTSQLKSFKNYSFQNMTFYILLKRKFDADQPF